MEFSTKQKRSFVTVLSGLKLARFGCRDVRFLTLTSSLLWAQSEGSARGSINDDFQILRKRILRYSPYRLYKEGYITKGNMIKKYGRRDLFKKFVFEYFKVETNEGNGVVHILYRGSYLPYNFIVDNWQDVHLSWDINIMKIDLNDCKKASVYVVGQYVGRQGCSYVKSSQSWRWIYRGWRTYWRDLVWQQNNYDFSQNLYEWWDNHLRSVASAHFYPCATLDDFG